MSKQSISGNLDSAKALRRCFKAWVELLDSYLDIIIKIKEAEASFWTKIFKGVSGIIEYKNPISKSGMGDPVQPIKQWRATGIQYNGSDVSKNLKKFDSLKTDIKGAKGILEGLNNEPTKLEDLASNIAKYQKEINQTLRDDKMKKSAVSSMAAAGFASNKYDAKSKDFIPKNKVSTDPEDWEGDLKFERQDNGTYLVIKVGKDGSEVPMGYTTKKGKNAYYEKATKKVLKSEKEKNSTSSNEKTTSDKFENVTSASNKSTTSKSESSSTNYVSSSEIKKKMKSTFLSSNLSDDEKSIVSEKMAKDLKKKNISLSDLKSKNKSELKDYDYYYNVVGENGKKYVKVEASRMGSTGGRERIFTSKYEIGADTTLRDAAHSNGLGKSYTPK